MSETPFYRDDELASLLAALDDLDEEFAAGDMSSEDYETLKGDYTLRVADTMRRLEGGSSGTATSTASDTGTATSKTSKPSSARQATEHSSVSPSRRLLTGLGVLVFAVGAGVLLAQSAGERGVNEILTGSIGLSSRQQIQECQEMAAGGGDLLGSLECLDAVLEQEPENVEALSYRAWYLVLAAGGSPDADDAQVSELFESAEVYLDEALDIEPNYPDARAFRAVVHDRQGDSTAACADISALLASDPPPFFIDQTRPIAERNGCG